MNAPATPRELEKSHAITRPEDLVGYELIRTLVGFPTVSRDSNLELIHWVRDYVERHGATTSLTFDDDRRKANLFVTFAAQDGNATTGGIVLSGHTDVVPVDGQPWNTDPFTVVHKDGRLYGRGVTDMKSFSATGLAFVPELLRRGLDKPVHFALSYDEEIGCIGVHRLIADVVARGVKPAGCIVGEPTGMQLVVAHKGKMSWRCRVRGHEAQSSLTPKGVNAVQIACEIVAYIARRAREFRDHGHQEPTYDVPFTTVHVGTIKGGTALNIVPRDCQFDFEIRHLPFDDPQAFFRDVEAFAGTFIADMHAVSKDTYIAFDHMSTLPFLDTDDSSDIAKIGHRCNCGTGVGRVSYGTEAALFYHADIPTVICGPGHIDQAHQPNEWCEVSQLAACEAFFGRLADHVCVKA